MTELHTLLHADDGAALDRLHATFRERAGSAGLVDVAYRTLPSPVGELLLAATSEGLVRVAYDVEDHDAVLASLAERISPRVLRLPARLDDTARQLDEYFAGSRDHFALPLDLRLRSGFRLAVLEQLRRQVRYGKVISYGALAEAVGNPRAVRAVGSACATNPLPVVVPCHRVVRHDGAIGNYIGGVAAKRTLLEMEAGRAGSPT